MSAVTINNALVNQIESNQIDFGFYWIAQLYSSPCLLCPSENAIVLDRDVDSAGMYV